MIIQDDGQPGEFFRQATLDPDAFPSQKFYFHLNKIKLPYFISIYPLNDMPSLFHSRP